ncbi:MAG: T9SS type A sorting domain-containing protein [Bacteroidota bacterium]
MNKVYALLLCLFAFCTVNGQSIQEICESSVTNGTVVDCEFFDDALYATGFFSVICGEPTGFIAKWEEDEWVPASIGLSDPGHSLRVIDDKLYIARYEESIDSNWVYVYDGATLEKVGPGVYLTTASGFSQLPNIYDIIEYDGKIIACGEFDRVGEAAIQGIMQWDGTTWEALGDGLSGSIPGTPSIMFPHQLLVHNDELYVVGNFRDAGGQEVNGIAKWDGTSWTGLGAGFDNTVYSLTVFNGDLIAGGSFTESDGVPMNRIARWNGSNWEALDFGFTPSSSNDFIFVHTLKVIDGELYMGGGLKEITYADGSTEACDGIVSFSGSTLNTFMGGVPQNDIEAICKLEDGRLLFGGGVFGSGYTGIADLSTSVVESPFTTAVSIAPNPFTDYVLVESSGDILQYEVVNQLGAILARGVFENRIELELFAGIYFLKLMYSDYTFSAHKIIRQ